MRFNATPTAFTIGTKHWQFLRIIGFRFSVTCQYVVVVVVVLFVVFMFTFVNTHTLKYGLNVGGPIMILASQELMVATSFNSHDHVTVQFLILFQV